MKEYNLSFITDENLYEHVKDTIRQYKEKVNLKSFNTNLIDPIKLTFDSKVYGKEIKQIINEECYRQLDKSNSNIIGYFHQNMFNYLGGKEWEVPKEGFDIINKEKKIYVEMKNKHNTMNSSSTKATYEKMKDMVEDDEDCTCYLVEVIAKQSQDIIWNVTIKKEVKSDSKIKRMSIENFYALVTGNDNAFKELVEALPKVIDDVIEEVGKKKINFTVFEELERIDKNTLKSLYKLAFNKYAGFDDYLKI